MRVAVIGAYGLIGSGITQRLVRDGHTVIGVGRDAVAARQVHPRLDWRLADMRQLTRAEAWTPLLANVDAVVNCSGALQDGPADDLSAVQHNAVAALAETCAARGIRIVQISAIGATHDAPTAFMRTKALGDDAIRKSGAAFVILRPGLVLSQQSYGGTALLRMLATVPLVQPLALPNAKIQTVSNDDVARIVSAALSDKLPDRYEADLVEAEVHSLRDLVNAMRNWLGFGPARYEWHVPAPITRGMSLCADQLARLGWRSPLRSTAVTVLSDGVTGSAPDLAPLGLEPLQSLTETLHASPARSEDRLAARIHLLMPLLVAVMAVFWFLSGLIALVQVSAAASVLTAVGWSGFWAVSSVVFWACVDIGIAAALVYRPTAKRACWAAFGVSLFYLGSATVVTPHLWADPLGPLVKVLPALGLALVTRVALETR